MAVPYTFGTATSSIPLSQLDSNFATVITLGNTAIQLGNTVTTLNNMTLANVTISSGNVTITNVAITTANVTTANITTAVIGTETVTTSTITSANITTANVTTANITTGNVTTGTVSTSLTLSYGTANGVAYLNGSKVLTTGSVFVFDGTNVGIGTNSPTSLRSTNLEVYNASGASVVIGTASTSISTLRLARKDATDGWDINYNFPAASMLSFNKLGTNAGPLFNIDSSGNVGIGTSTPQSILHIRKDASGSLGPTLLLQNASGGVDGSSARYATTIVSSGNFAVVSAIDSINRTANYDTDMAFSLYANTGALQERMRITYAGNVGIGTSSPSTKLTVGTIAAGTLEATYKGNIRIEGTETTIESQGGLEFKMTSDGYGAKIQTLSSGGTNLVFATRNASATWTERMRIDPSGNVGIGFSSGLGTYGQLEVGGSANSTMALRSSSGSGVIFALTSVGATEARINAISNVPMTFYTNNTERARIDSNGDLLVGGTTTGGRVTSISSTNDLFYGYNAAQKFAVTNGGTIFAVVTTISSISDIRYKENVRDLDVGLDKIMALKPRLYDWKEGKGADIKNARGFIAQEFEQVFPDLVDEWKDPVPKGEEPYKSVRQDLIPVLVKAIQEQQALITSLTARITALEST